MVSFIKEIAIANMSYFLIAYKRLLLKYRLITKVLFYNCRLLTFAIGLM